MQIGRTAYSTCSTAASWIRTRSDRVLRNYFTAAIRNLFRNRAYAAINLCGLALGFMAAILIALFVRDEYSYDRFFPDYQRISRVRKTVQFPNRPPMYRSMTFSYVAAALRREFPEVQI